jgi:hypothetical protein
MFNYWLSFLQNIEQRKEKLMTTATTVGIAMITTGVVLLGVVVWRATSHRQKQRNLDDHLDD